MKTLALASLVVAACAGGVTAPSAPSTPAPSSPAPTLELAEIRMYDGANVTRRYHADGSYDDASPQVTRPAKAGHDAPPTPPVTWRKGRLVAHPDGTIDLDGKPAAKIALDGTVTELATHATLPVIVTSERVTFPVSGSEPIVMALGVDGQLSSLPGVPPSRIEGADTPAKRRLVLAIIGVEGVLIPATGDAHAS